MAKPVKHEGHSEPGYASTSLGAWAITLPVVWVLIDAYGDVSFAIGFSAIWLLVSLVLISWMNCRNARNASGGDTLKFLIAAVGPYVLFLWGYFVLGVKQLYPS